MEMLKRVIETEGGLAMLVLLSPTIALGVFGFLWFKSTRPGPLVPRYSYDAVLSSMRKEQGLMASHIYNLSERIARIEAMLEERGKS